MSIALVPGVGDAIKAMARESADGRETGGILLGRGPDEDGVVKVERAGDPGPEARREPGFFLRDLGHAQWLADEAWDQSKAVWIGEWHTHVHGDPRPSATDLGTHASLLAATDLHFDLFVSIIVVPDAEQDWGSRGLHRGYSPSPISRPKPRSAVGSVHRE